MIYCKGRHQPLMYIEQGLSYARHNYFLRNKYKTLYEKINYYDSKFVFFEASDFISMIQHFISLRANGLRIYMASFKKDNVDETIPPEYNGLLTLIFAPTIKQEFAYTDIGKYYFFFRNDGFDPIESEIDINTASIRVNNYVNDKLPILNTTVSDPKIGDTRSLLYDQSQIVDLIEEIRCQKASGVKIYFSSYLPSEKNNTKQLILDFSLTEKIGEDHVDFNIEDRDGWNDRKPNPILINPPTFFSLLGLDTGSPCPPQANCDGAALPKL